MDDLIRSNGFGPFYCQGVEILRRVFVTVRDRNWREISPTHWNCKVNEALQTITVEARHVSELVDFTWAGTLQVRADGRSVHFSFEGEAQRTMEVCRLGLVVLHAVETVVGARITARGPEGPQTLVVAPTIAPQPIIEGMPAAMMQPFSSLKIERFDIGRIELHYSGDLFEIEDQRNWGDASFKTYCTPLRAGFPRLIDKGARIAHCFALRFTPPIEALAGATQTSRPAARGVFPTIGRSVPGPSSLVSQGLHWRHLHVDLSHLDDLGELEAGLDHQTLPLEIGVQDRGSDDQKRALSSWVAARRARILRLLLYGEGTSPPSALCVARWRQALDASGAGDLPLFAATRGYFVEFNRSREAPTGDLSGLFFPLTATVHADDPRTIGENVATIRDIAATAHHSMKSQSLGLAPLALYYPLSRAHPGFPQAMIAPWLTATLMHAAAAGVTSVTLANDVVSTAPASLLVRLLECAGHSVTLLVNDQPNGVHAGVLHSPGQPPAQILAVNLNSVPTQFQLKAFAECVRSFRDVCDGVAIIVDGTHVEIPAFGVCWLECELC